MVISTLWTNGSQGCIWKTGTSHGFCQHVDEDLNNCEICHEKNEVVLNCEICYEENED